MPSVLPAALVSNPATIEVPAAGGGSTPLTGFSPDVAADPINSSWLVEVHTTGSALVASFSEDGGQTWTSFINAQVNVKDPTTNAPFTTVTDPTVAIDRAQNIYITDIERNATLNTSGALVFQRWYFLNNGGLSQAVNNNVIQEWVGADPIENPVVAVDNNVTSFTDTTAASNRVQTDTMATIVGDPTGANTAGVNKALYVAYNTTNKTPANAPNNWEANVIMATGSGDGGTNWAAPQIVSDGGNTPAIPNGGVTPHYSDPQLVFTQGSADGRVTGGQLTFAWNDYGNNTFQLDASQPDNAVAANPAAASYSFNGGTGTFLDAGSFVSSVSINNGGNNYTTGNVLTAAGGTIYPAAPPTETPGPQPGSQATFNTTENNSPGPVTGVSIGNPGFYIVRPGTPNTATGGAGSGASLNLGFTDVPETRTYTDNVILPNNFNVNDLQVTLDLTDPRVQDLTIELDAPGVSPGNGIFLVEYPTSKISGANLGEITTGGTTYDVGTVFDDDAPRSISDASFTAPYIARFTPQVGKLDIPGVTTGTNVDNGSWTLRVTDNVNDNTATAPVESVDNWTLTFSHISTTGFGTDRTVPGLSALTGVPPVTGAANEPYPLVTNASGPQGISPGISLAVDNTLGAYSPYEGRIYLAYTAAPPKGNPATDTNIDLITGDNLRPNRAPTWSTPVQVNDDSVTDGFSEGTRPQFMPTVAVDQTTGTVGVMYYDGRWDPSLFRVANSFSDSIDGGHTFSTSTFLNTPKTATDAITEQSITIEPVPGNQGQVPAVNGTSFGFGDRQGLVMVAGHVIPVFASNDNIAGSFIKSATVTLAAGPRIIFGDMGPIVADFTSPVGTATYNNTFAADGTRQFNGFVIEFDRPVVVSSFTPNQVTIVYHDTVTPAALPGVTIPTADYTVNPLDGFTPFGRLPASTDNVLATTFLVQLNTGEERSAVGTYSYAIGNLTGAPTINDGIKTVASPTVGNFMDQNQNAVTGEVPNSTSPGDVFAVPTPTAGPPFQLPYDSSTLPLIIPGPHVTSTSVAFNPAASTSATDNLVLNGTNNGVDVTFDRNIQPATFTPANVLRIEGPLGPITTYTLGPAVSFSGGGGSGASGIATIVGGLVTAVTITNSGSGYTSAPTVVFTGGGGVGAIGAATIAGGKVTGVTVTSGGVGYTSTPAQTIPAAGTLNVPLTITDSLQVNDLSVGLDITQANVSALAVTLIAPDGTQVQLVPAGTLSGANLTAAIFDDFASTLITAGTAPYSGLFRPVPPVLAAAISAGGSGYKVGDILTVQGGTFLTPAQLKVTSVAGGAVTGVTIVQSGAYSVEPYNPVSVTDATTPAASGATFTLSFGGLSALNGKNYLGTWTLRIQNSGAAGTLNAWSLNPVTVSPYTLGVSSAVPVNAAKNYNVFDILTVMGGTFAAGQQAQLLVTSVSATGAITGVFVLTPGLYALKPGTPVTVIGGTGTGATFTLGYTAATTATTFHISFPTQTVSGTYTVVVGPDSQGNYIEDTSLDRATVVTGGSGYNVGDLLTVKGGTGTAAEFQVTTVNGGAITGVELVDPGSYTVNPPSTTGVTDVTTPSAANATLTLFFGNKVDTSLDAGVDLLRGVVINGGTLLQAPYASGLINTPLPAGQTVESTINVPDSYIVQGATVTLTIKHNNDPDLVATLIAPDGTSDLLFSGVGASGSSPHANFTNTTLDDAALTPIQLATTVPGIGIGAGPYNPQQPLTTAFKGHGSLGSWTLEITSNSSTINGTLVSWSLNLKNTVDGVGALVASQFTAPFRIFTQDPTNSVSQQSWTAVGPASINNGGDSGRIGGLAVDPSDPSGNTVYTAGASGGVWKTTDFMTTNPNGPTWIPLTNLGPANSLNTGSIAVFGRNNNPNQSIIFVATGEGSTSTPGVGFLRSMDGGRTWEVLDSSTNVDAAGNILPISSASRDHKFVGSTAFKVVVDPKPAPTGQVIVYAALSSGVWRSVDTGQHWTLMQAGDASDVVLAAGSAGSTGNLQILYAAVEGKGVYFTNNATATLAMTLQNGNSGNAIRRDVDVTPDQAIPITNDGVNPSQGGGGRITLAAPALTGNPLEDTLYEGWCYAVVATAGGAFGGLYVTKDFGLNWTKVRLPVLNPFKPTETSTNNDSIATDDSVTGSAQFPQANYNVSLAVDPNNANVVYIGGTADANPDLNTLYGGFIRVDISTIVDPYAVVAYDNSNNDGGTVQLSTQGAVTLKGGGISAATGAKLGAGQPYGMINPDDPTTYVTPLAPYFNMLRDPESPFLTPSSLQFTNIASFGNSGEDARYNSFTGGEEVGGSGGNPEDATVLGGGVGGTDQHQLVAFKDPVTGLTRLIFGDDQGIWTGTDNGTGNPIGDVGSAVEVGGSRNGNLQITQFYDGATQPSTLAADIAQAEFYGVAQDDGFPTSTASVLDTGQLNWSGPGGDGAGVKVDQTGSGNAYYYKWPCCGGSNPLPTDFWTVVFPVNNEVSRTTGLIQKGDNPGYPASGQWPYEGGSKFAVNPIDGTSIVMSSQAGRIFLTSGPSLGTGVQWFPIADPKDLDSTYAPALAFGAPANADANLSDFIYVGTTGGHIYVTFTGGGVGAGAPTWNNISTGLDGSAVQFIVANPNRGSHEAYAVTSDGVYWMPDSSVASPTWINVTGNLFSASLTRTLFNDPAQALATLQSLTALQADWRYGIPDSSGGIAIAASPVGASEVGNVVTITTTAAHGFTVGQTVQISGVGVAGYNGIVIIASVPSPTTFTYTTSNQGLAASGGGTATPTHPVLYAGGVGGVYRSLDQGKTWTYFPDTTIDGALQAGGLLPTASSLGVTDLALSLGNIDPLNGIPSQPYGRNMLVATTYGVGTWAIRLDDQVRVPGGNPLYTYAVNPVAGPHVASIGPVVDGNGVSLDGILVTFSGPVDPATFTTAKLNFVTDPFGNPVPVASILDLGATNHNEYEIVFANPSEAFGFYHVSLGPNISDYSGDKMDQNQNGINGETPGDIYTARFLYQPFTNTAPVLNNAASGAIFAPVPPVLEDQTAAMILGTSVNNFVTAMAAPLAYITDADNFTTPGYQTTFTPPYQPTTAPVGIAVTGVDDSNGDWQYSLDNGTIWIDFGPFDAKAAALAAAGSGYRVGDLLTVQGGTFSTAAQLQVTSIGAGGTITGVTIVQDGLYAADSVQPSNPVSVTDVTTPAASGATFTLTFVAIPGVDSFPTAAVLLEANSNGIASPDQIRFLPNPDFSGTSTFTFRAWDLTSGLSVYGADGGTADTTINGGSTAFSSATATATLSVLFVNDQPTFTASNPPPVPEDSGANTVSGWVSNFNASGDAGGPDPNEASQAVLRYIVSNVTNPGLFSVLPAVSTTGTLTYTLNPDVNGTSKFDVKVQDNGGTQVLGAALAAGGTGYQVGDVLTVLGGTSFTPAQLQVTSVGAGGAITGVTVTQQDGAYTAQPANPVSVTDTTTPAASGAKFTLTFGGIDTSVAQTFTISALFVNDQPTFTATNPPPVAEDNTAPQTLSGWASNFNASGDAGGPDPNEASQTVLQYIVSNVTNPGLFSVLPAVDTSGNLTYTLNPAVSGTSNFNVQVQDNGGTQALAAAIVAKGTGYQVGDVLTVLGGTSFTPAQLQVTSVGAGGVITGVVVTQQDGAYTVQPANPVSVTDATTPAASGATFTLTFGGVDTSTAQTFTISVLFVNDQPTFIASNPPPVPEDTTSQQTLSGWANSFNASGDAGGPDPNEASQAVLRYIVSNVTNPGLFSVLPAIDTSGNLTYTLNPDLNGTSNFDVQVQDNGGTQVLAAVIAAGGTGYQVGDVLTVLGGTSFTPAQLQVTSVGAGGAITGVVVTQQDGAYTAQPANPVSVNDVTTPAASGASFTLTFGGVDTSTAQTFTVSVLFVNDQPTFTASNPPVVLEDSGANTVTGWVTNFNPDAGGAPDANEASQTILRSIVSNVTNPSLFSVLPAVDTSGNLTYTLNPDVNGTTNFDLKVQDNGGTQALAAAIVAGGAGYQVGDVLTVLGGTSFTPAQLQVTSVDPTGAITGVVVTQQDGAYTTQPANPVSVTDVTTPAASGASFTLTFGGVDTSAAQTFTLSVLFVNDQPTFTASNPPPVPEDSGANTVSGWVTNFNASGDAGGPDPNEASQTVLRYIVSNVTNPALFSVLPAIDTSGNLTYTLKPDLNGTSKFDVKVQDNGGIQVLGAAVAAGGSGYQVGDVLTVLGGTSFTPAQLQVTSVGVGGVITGVVVTQQDGAYTAQPANPVSVTDVTTPAASGASFTLTFGGVDTSAAQTFTLSVLFVNDQPTFTASNPPVVLEDSGANTVTSWATNFNPDAGGAPDANEAGQTIRRYIVSNVTNPGLFSVLPAVSTTGTLTYTLKPDVNGTTNFNVQVQDTGGTQVLAAALVAGGAGYQVGDVLTVLGGTSFTPAQLQVTSVGAGGAITGVVVTQQDGAYTAQPINPVSVTDTNIPGAFGAKFTLTFGGVDTSVAQTFTISALFVNDQPTFTASNPPPVPEDTTAPQTVSGWVSNFNASGDAGGPDPNEASQAVLRYIVSNVTNPSLFSVLPAVSTTGTLTYTLNPDVSGTSNFDVKVQDNGGTQALAAAIVAGGSGYRVGDVLTVLGGTSFTPAQLQVTSVGVGGAITGVVVTQQDGAYTAQPANPVSVSDVTTPAASGAKFTLTFGGVDTSAAQTFTISALFVNDQPTFTASNPPPVPEDSGANTVSGWVANFNASGDAGGSDPNEAGQTVLRYIVSNFTNPGLFSVLPAVDTSGNLTYTLNPDLNGTSNFDVQVQDNGGTQVLGAPVAAGGSGYKVGDVLTVLGGTSFTPAQLQVTSVGAGGAITGVVVTQQDGAYTAQPANPVSVTDVTTPAASGASFTLTFGGVDTSTAQTFTISALFVNDQPTFTASNPPPVAEDTTAQQTLSGWASNFNASGDAGGPDPNEAGQAVLRYIVSNVTNPALFSVLPAVDTSGNLTYTLNPDLNGTSKFDVKVQDNGGTQALSAAIVAGGSGYQVGDVLTVLGGTSFTPAQLQVTSVGAGGAITGVVVTQQDGAYTAQPANPVGVTDTTTPAALGAAFTLTFGGVDTSAAQTFTISALFVNDQPTFTASNPPFAYVSTGGHTVTGWATNFNPDAGGAPDANEAGQTLLRYIVGNVTNPSLFSVLPAVSTTGTLTYTLAPLASGTTNFDVKVQDNGGTQALAAAVAAGGSGYQVGDVLIVLGGTSFTPAQLQVTSVGAGGTITGVVVTQQDGAYTAQPANPVSVTDATTPAASGAKFTLTFGGVDTSAAQTFTLNVLKYDSAVAVSAGPAAPVSGQVVTFTATVTSKGPSTATPGGTVDFLIDNTPVATGVLLVGGRATFSTSSLIAANSPYSVTVNFHDGDRLFNDSTGSLAGGEVIGQAKTTTTLSSPLNPSTYGQTVTITAAVRPVTPGGGIPDGSVTFTVDNVSQGAFNLNASGNALLITNSLSVGTHTIQANYTGSLSYLTSAGSLTGGEVVNKAPTSTMLTSTFNPSRVNEPLLLTATVTSSVATPDGTVTFLIDGVSKGTVTLSGGQATLLTAAPALGNHTLTANYSGSGNFAVSSRTLTQVVKKAGTLASSVAVVSSEAPSTYGDSVTFTATVSGSGAKPTGAVTFAVDGLVQGIVAVDNSGRAQIVLSNLNAGPRSILVTYYGDNTYAASSRTITQTVNKLVSSTALTSSAGPVAIVGTPVTFTATVSNLGPAPSGTVTFFVDGVKTATVNLSGNQATFTTTTLAVGSRNVSATYNGTSNVTSSTGTFTELVSKPGTNSTTTTLTSSANPSTVQQLVSFTATVTANTGGTTPTGWVQFLVDGVSVTYTQLDVFGQATYATSALAIGAHKVTAVYYGDLTYAKSTSALLVQTVNAAVPPSNYSVSLSGSGLTRTMIVTALLTATQVDTSDNAPVSFSIISAPAGQTIQGGNTAVFVNGVATFPNLTATKTGSYVIEIFSGNLDLLFTITFTAGRQT